MEAKTVKTDRILFQTDMDTHESESCVERTTLDETYKDEFMPEDKSYSTDRGFLHVLLDEWLDWATKLGPEIDYYEQPPQFRLEFCNVDHSD